MYIIALLLIPIIIILIFILVIGFIAYAKIRQLWYTITGRKPESSSHFSFRTYGFGNSNSSAGQTTRDSSQSNKQKEEKKIFSKDEGEYVDFEIVE